MKVNYYEVLGVERSASEQEIRDRFRRLAREQHPDRYTGTDKAEAERRFQLLTEPVNTLFLKDAGLICKRAGLVAKAERYLDEALKWDADNIEVQSALAELRQGRGESKESGKGFTLFKKG